MNKSYRIWEAAKAWAVANPDKPSLVVCVDGAFTLTWTPKAEPKGADYTYIDPPVAPAEGEALQRHEK